MPRERWFYAQSHQRRGPVALGELVENVLKQGEPRAVLVWRKGFADWTQAEDVPEVERRLAPFLARKAAAEAARRTPAPAPAAPAQVTPPPAPSGASPMLIYGGVATGVIVTGLVAWLLWPRAEVVAPADIVPLGGTTAENAPAVVIPAPAAAARGTAPAPETTAQPTPAAAPAPVATPPPAPAPTPAATAPQAAASAGDHEQELPIAELRNLRQVAAWSGTQLELTIYNGTAWRITEVYVRIQRYVGNEVVDDETPVTLVPPQETVDEGVASLLSKVAPDRKKPGVNPNDTGKFSGLVGPPPEGFRCEIVSARGYPPS
jgi:hypothetical protein